MRGTPKGAIAYAKKEESRVTGPREHGVYLKRGYNKRKISDGYEEDPDDLRYDEPSKYRRIHCDSITRSNSELFPDFCRECQIHVQRLINEEPDNRQIIWVYGEDGNEGKSTFARHLYQNCNWFYTRGGKTDNFIY
ncbi:Para-Rep C6 [Camellia lanceoleosa]|uniref:Para-Rep C6 n=1 Tax=Camellia lanceoleosa TaxID=1840588 RepID=A0ACC0IE30_9ERIC|nr:Para-Rep C6 [Camellia lanceoleosa]